MCHCPLIARLSSVCCALLYIIRQTRVIDHASSCTFFFVYVDQVASPRPCRHHALLAPPTGLGLLLDDCMCYLHHVASPLFMRRLPLPLTNVRDILRYYHVYMQRSACCAYGGFVPCGHHGCRRCVCVCICISSVS